MTMKERKIESHNYWQTWGLYGGSGVGKSSLASTAPQPYVLDSNDGLLSIADKPGLEHVRGDRVMSMSDLDEVYAKASGTHGARDWRKKYHSYVYDHFNDIQGIIMDELGERALAKDDRREIDEWQQKEYGIMANKLSRHLRKWKKLPAHKMLLCGEAQDFETGVMRPALIGSMKHQFSYFCDHIAYMRVGKKGVRYLHLDPTDEYFAKTRAWWLAPQWRKMRVELADTTFMTRLIDEIRKGPQPTRAAKKTTTSSTAVPAGRKRRTAASSSLPSET